MYVLSEADVSLHSTGQKKRKCQKIIIFVMQNAVKQLIGRSRTPYILNFFFENIFILQMFKKI